MIIERYKRGKAEAIYERFSSKGRMLPSGVEYVNSWVEKDLQTCYQVMSSESRGKLEEWMAKWEDLVDFEVIPVINSDQANRAITKPNQP